MPRSGVAAALCLARQKSNAFFHGMSQVAYRFTRHTFNYPIAAGAEFIVQWTGMLTIAAFDVQGALGKNQAAVGNFQDFQHWSLQGFLIRIKAAVWPFKGVENSMPDEVLHDFP